MGKDLGYTLSKLRTLPGLLAWLLICVALLGQPTRARADTATDDYNLAVSLYKQSRWATAAERFRTFLKTHDKSEKVPLVRLYLGLTLLNMEDYKAARDELRGFARDYPQNNNIALARYRIAECSYLIDDLATARTELDAYLKDFPKDTFHDHALPFLADTQLKLNDPAAALVNFQIAIDRFPEGPLIEDARFGRARALEALKRDDEAIAQFKELVAKPKGSRAADAQFHLATLSFDRQRYPEAAAAYVELTKNFPNNRFVPVAHLNAGYAYYQSGKFAEAAAQFEVAANEKSQRVNASYWWGLSLKGQGQFAKAVEVLKGAAKAAGDLPLAESILFQQGQCERQLGSAADAQQSFQTVLTKWAKGDLADDSLHALAEMSIEAGDLKSADQLLARLATEFPQSNLRWHSELLAGRVELAKAAIALRDQKPAEEVTAGYEAAARRFTEVLNNSKVPLEVNQARYDLARARQLQGQSSVALELLAPLVESVRAEGAKSELTDAFVLQADALLSEKKFDEADKAANEYLTLQPRGTRAAHAVSIQAVAAARKSDTAKTDAALDRLKKEFAEHPLRASAIQQVAELAESRDDWATAAKLYEELVPISKGSESQPYAIRGLAAAQLKLKQPDAAAKSFAKLVQDFPNHRLALEAAYFRAESLREAGSVNEAITAFGELLRKVPPDKPAEAGAEEQNPLQFSFKAGLQAARLLRKAKRIPEADAEYDELVRRFPKPQSLDKLLDEWALLNYDAGRYERADELFRRIVTETPGSDLADNAKLSLAESDLVAERLDVAQKSFEELLASEKSDTEVKERSLFQLVALAVDHQRWADVRQLASRLATEFPNSQYRWYASYSVAESILANAKATDAELDDARDRFNALRKEQDNPEVKGLDWFDRIWVQLAEIAFRQKKYDDIATTVAELRQRSPKSRYLYQAEEVLGRGYKQQAPPKFDEARKAFERVLADPVAERTETAAKCQFMIGETLYLQEKWGDAFLAYQKVYANYKFPDWRAAALLQSGKCDEQQQQWKLAAASYRLLLDEFPKSTHAAEARQRLEAVTKKPGG